jgi:hypothetical protein
MDSESTVIASDEKSERDNFPLFSKTSSMTPPFF